MDNDKIGEVKDFIHNNIVLEKDRVLQLYNDKLLKLSNMENLSDMYYIISEIYDETEYGVKRQKDVAIEFMNQTLINSFFREAIIKRNDKSISFYNNQYNVAFPTTKDKKITIEYYSTTNPFDYKDFLTDEEYQKKADIANLTKQYLDKPSLPKLKELYNIDKSANNGIYNHLMTLLGFNKESNQNKYKDILKELSFHHNQKKIYNEALKIFNVEKLAAIEFAKSLEEDLKVYIESDWIIEVVEMRTGTIA